jgi:glutathione reductase (NADPH)
MPTRSFDVVMLGGGNAGMGATVATREAGLKVAMLEPDLLGGTCPNRGCMPKKVLVAAAQAAVCRGRADDHLRRRASAGCRRASSLLAAG